MRSPVLFLIFDRPYTAERVFEEIRKARPPRLYVAADGPRPDRPQESELCELTRAVIAKVDWDCEVKTLFREKNLGCGVAVHESISWFFENEAEGIILEDDILPHPDFFQFCDELLERYRNDDRVAMIGGHNVFYPKIDREFSYGFMSISHIWGWATWRRAWNQYDYNLERYSRRDFVAALKNTFSDIRQRMYWKRIYDMMKAHRIDTWDYQWVIGIITTRSLSVVPYVNLTKNIGFDANATHTLSPNIRELNAEILPIMPLHHPDKVEKDFDAEERDKNNEGTYMKWSSFCRYKVSGLLRNLKKILSR